MLMEGLLFIRCALGWQIRILDPGKSTYSQLLNIITIYLLKTETSDVAQAEPAVFRFLSCLVVCILVFS